MKTHKLVTIKKIHRKYPENQWDYQAVSAIINEDGVNRNIIYYTVVDKGEMRIGVEVYQGPNYVDDTGKNWSKNYKLKDLPEKYQPILEQLMEEHAKQTWSKEPRVELN